MESPLSSRVARRTTGVLMDRIDQYGSIDARNTLIPLTWSSPRLDVTEGDQIVESYSSAKDTLRTESLQQMIDHEALCIPINPFSTPSAVESKFSFLDDNLLAPPSPIRENYDFGTLSPRSGRFVPLSPISYKACVKFKTWKYPLLATSGPSDSHDDFFGPDKQDNIVASWSSKQSSFRHGHSRDSSAAEPSQLPRLRCAIDAETKPQAKKSRDPTITHASSQ